MTWIKLHYDRFILALFAAGLTVCAILLFINARNFSSVFATLSDVPPAQNHQRPVDLATLKSDGDKLAQPFTWKMKQKDKLQLPTFVSRPYIEQAEPDGRGGFAFKLVDPLQGDMVHPPIPNEWLIDKHQDLLAANVLTQDTDNDGFTTLDEFLGKTDPNNKDDHPPYYTKLFLKQFVRVPFRLLFEARNGPVCLINTIDIESPTQFLKVGDMVKGTKYKLTNLKIQSGNENGINKDTSEVTLTNIDTNETIILPKEKEVNSPTTYAVLTYVWNGGDIGSRNDFAVKKNGEFSIRPEMNVKYKCTDLSDTEVTVLKEDENKTITIKQLPKR